MRRGARQGKAAMAAGAARRNGGEHVLILIVIADAQYKVNRSLSMRAAQYAVGHCALVDAGEAYFYDAFDR